MKITVKTRRDWEKKKIKETGRGVEKGRAKKRIARVWVMKINRTFMETREDTNIAFTSTYCLLCRLALSIEGNSYSHYALQTYCRQPRDESQILQRTGYNSCSVFVYMTPIAVLCGSQRRHLLTVLPV